MQTNAHHRRLQAIFAALAMALLVIAVAAVRADDPFDISGDLGGDDDDDGVISTLQQKLFTSSLNAQTEQVLASLDVKARVALSAVKVAAKTFMEDEGSESEKGLIDAVNNFLAEQKLGEEAGDAALIANHLVLNLKEVSATQGICWACPACAIFAAPLSLSWPIFAASMKGRCTSSGPLTGQLRSRVACHFPSLNLNNIKLYWGCTFLNENVLFGRDIGMVPAQTFYNDIFIKESTKDDLDSAMLIVHELRHTQQYKNYGGLIPFGFKYLYHLCLRGFKYDKIDEEVDAYNFADSRSICTPTPTRKPTAPTTKKPTLPPTKKSNGALCTSNSQCQSGNCEEVEIHPGKPVTKRVCMP